MVYRKLLAPKPTLAASDCVTLGTAATKPALAERINALLTQIELNKMGSVVVCSVGAGTANWLRGNGIAAVGAGQLAIGAHRWVILVLDKLATLNDVYTALSGASERLVVYGLVDGPSIAEVLGRRAPKRLTNLAIELRFSFSSKHDPCKYLLRLNDADKHSTTSPEGVAPPAPAGPSTSSGGDYYGSHLWGK